MRWRRVVALLGSLLLVLAGVGPHGFAREISRKAGLEASSDIRSPSRGAASSSSSSSPAPSGSASFSLDPDVVDSRCKSKVLGFCGFLGKGNKVDNSTLVEEEKRVVPTGPNPLHNR